jgi:hypothetical protein
MKVETTKTQQASIAPRVRMVLLIAAARLQGSNPGELASRLSGWEACADTVFPLFMNRAEGSKPYAKQSSSRCVTLYALTRDEDLDLAPPGGCAAESAKACLAPHRP